MIILLKIILISSLLIIAYQDFKDRYVWWFLFPLMAFSGTSLFFAANEVSLFVANVASNILMVFVLLSVLFLYARYILKKSLTKELLGVADILLFIGFAMSFPTLSFLSFFISALIGSFILGLLFHRKKGSDSKGIPLAGYLSVFFLLTYTVHWTGWYPNIYRV